MHKLIATPAIIAISIALAACSSKPNPNLEQARANFNALQMDPLALQLAPLETKDASEFLEKSDKAYNDGAKQDKVDQLAYLTNQRVELAKQTIALKSAERNLKGISEQRSQAQLDAREAEIRALQEKLNAKPSDRGQVVTFGDLLFDLNRAELKPAAYNNVRNLADFLRQNPERKVLIEGFTDSTGSDTYNLTLSQARADSVRRALAQQGIDMSRIRTQGFGKAYPVADNATSASRAMNRRVEITISNDDQQVRSR